MIKNTCIRSTAAAALLALFGTAYAQVAEVEPNNAITAPQRLAIRGADGVTVQGSISSTSDVDFYSFKAKAGDFVSFDIDGGMTTDQIGLHSTLTVFGPVEVQPINMLRAATQSPARSDIDTGSLSRWDARIDGVPIPQDGTYIVVVAGYPNVGQGGGGVLPILNAPFDSNSTGNYTLIITGATPGPSVLPIAIDVKPRDHSTASPITMRSNGRIPVALLSSADFDPFKVKQESLRFGHDGTEMSLARCSRDNDDDFNKDGKPDLVCQFNIQSTMFVETDTEGVLTGELQDGTQIEGRGALKVIPADMRRHHDDHDRDHDRDRDRDGRGDQHKDDRSKGHR